MWDRMDPEVASKVAIAAASIPTSAYVVPVWGATLGSFGLAALGSFMSYAWTPPEKSRGSLIFKSFSVTCFSVALVVVMPYFLDIHLPPEAQPAMAFIIATFGRSIMPALKKAAPTIAAGIAAAFGRGASGYNSGSSYEDQDDTLEDEDRPTRRKNPGHKATNDPPEGY